MFISELPDDCLLIIFDLINELDDLLNCYKVCSKWSHLIEERTRKVKYLVEHQDWRNDEPSLSYPFDWVFYRTEEPIDGTCLSTLFPNLMIADFSDRFCEKVKHEDIVTLAKKIKHLKGLFNPIHRDGRSVFQYCDQLEMVSIRQIEPCIEKNGFNVKQLKLWDLTLEIFKHHVHYFPNLERLSIYNEAKPDGPYDGPILTSLKIVELELSSYDGKIIHVYYGFQFMDWCPNLQSAHIRLESNRLFVDESVKHNSLRDLVLDIYPEGIEWSELKRLFIKYPNLKNLAFYSYYRMENAHVEQLVRLLPNLVLLVVFDCGVDQKAADYVQEYNKLHGRSIKFYFDDNHHEIQSDWPQFSKKGEKISLGFDFMKNCFLKHSLFLSTFLISDDD